jgi:hypothetical protein
MPFRLFGVSMNNVQLFLENVKHMNLVHENIIDFG